MGYKKEFDNFKYLWFDAMVTEGNTAWVFANNFNALFSINLVTYEMNYLGSVPGEMMLSMGLYLNMQKYGNELVLVPAYANSVAIYNIDTQIFRTIPIDLPDAKCFGSAIYKNRIYMVGNSSAKIIVINLQDDSIKVLEQCEKYLENKEGIPNRMRFRKNNCVVDGCFYIASCVSSTIVKLDMNTDEMEFFELDIHEEGFRSIVYDGNYFWLSLWDDVPRLVQWSVEKGVVNNIVIPENGKYRVSDIIVYDNSLILFPNMGKHVYEYNLREKSWEVISEYEDFLHNEICMHHPWSPQKFPISRISKGKIYSFCGEDFKLLEYELEKKRIRAEYLCLDDFLCRIMEGKMMENVLMERQFSLELFLNVI